MIACNGLSGVTSGSGRGAFILFEGIDRCGKTTQSKLLLECLVKNNVAAELWRFPDRSTSLGQTINAYLSNQAEMDDAAMHLVFAANRWEKRNAMLAALRSGTTLVVDRYSYSGIAYSCAKDLAHLNLEWCKGPEIGLPAPDVVLYMQLSPEAGAGRGGYGEERYEKAEFQKKVARNFEALRDQTWVSIQADQSIEAVHAQVVEAVAPILQHAQQGAPIRRLWDNAPIDRPDNERGFGDAFGAPVTHGFVSQPQHSVTDMSSKDQTVTSSKTKTPATAAGKLPVSSTAAPTSQAQPLQ